MQRRHFVLGAACAALGAPSAHAGSVWTVQRGTTATASTSTATTTSTAIDVVAQIKSLRIPSGPYAGGFEIAPNGRLNWYFTNLGLLSIVQYLSAADLDAYVRPYLELYLRSLNANCSIDDVDFPLGRADPATCTRVLSDSDDSYAATLLSLAARYLRASGNWAWFDANKARLKDVAYRNLALAVKTNGLTSVFQAPRNASNSIGYLMDNCEALRGLRDFAALLRDRADADASYYDGFANAIGAAVARLFKPASLAFVPGDAYVSTDTSFYPGATCQVFPQAFGVAECQSQFDAGWAYLNKFAPGWETGGYDPYPWAILGFVAAKRGQSAQANTQLTTVEKKFTTNRSLVTINELGFYQRTRSVLAGRADV
jgi:hypothetical protein